MNNAYKINLIIGDMTVIVVGNGVYAVCQWLMLSYLARRWGFVVVGHYVFALSILAPVFTASFLALRVILSTDSSSKVCFQLFLQIRLFTTILVIVGVCTCLIIFNIDVDRVRIMILVLLLKSIDGISDIFYGAMHRDKRGYRQGVSLILRCSLGVVVFYSAIKITGELSYGFFALTILWCFIALMYDAKITKTQLPSLFNILTISYPKEIYKLISISAPLVISSTLGALVYNSPRYAVESVLGTVYLGYFAALTSFSIALNLLSTSVGLAILPWISSAHELRKIGRFSFLLLLGVFVVIVGVATTIIIALYYGEGVLSVLFGRDVARHADIFPALLALSMPLLIGQVLSYGSMAVKEFKYMALITIIGGLVSILFAKSFTVKYGLLGGGYIMASIGMVQVIGYTLIIVNNIIKIKNRIN